MKRSSLAAALLFAAPLCLQLLAQGRPDGCQSSCGICTAPPPATQPATELTAVERSQLLAMRREEKLAHDVYVTLGRKYALRPFERIPGSEKQHQAVMASLLAHYEITDPVKDLPEGKFDDASVQTLFDTLVAKGNENEIAAMKVGAEIEELDIKDLRTAIAATNQPELRDAYTALEHASQNHLRAFARNLSARGERYQASHLQQAEYDEIIQQRPGRGPGSH